MRAHLGQPTGTYNLILTKHEANRLTSIGGLSISAIDIPTTTSRLVYNPDKQTLETVEKKRDFWMANYQ